MKNNSCLVFYIAFNHSKANDMTIRWKIVVTDCIADFTGDVAEQES